MSMLPDGKSVGVIGLQQDLVTMASRWCARRDRQTDRRIDGLRDGQTN